MAFAFVGSASAVGSSVTSVDCSRPTGTAVGNLLIAVYAFEGVAAGSGPWIIPNLGQLASNFVGPSEGWAQACWAAPSATGVGLEVWWAIHGTGTDQAAQFAVSQNVTTVAVAYSGEYNPTGTVNPSTIRLAPTAQVTGSQPAAPTVTVNAGELVVAVGGDLMTASKFGSPSGFTNRVDVARSGAGTVEATVADAAIAAAASTGPITFPNNAAATTTAGATATLVVRPVPAVTGTGGVIDAGLPEQLDIGPGYTLRVVGLDAATGAAVAGVQIDQTAITATQIVGTPGELETGQWFLVPGPGA